MDSRMGSTKTSSLAKVELFRATGSRRTAALHHGLEAQQGIDQVLGLTAAYLPEEISSELWMVDLG